MKEIYLDNSATTPMCEEAIEAAVSVYRSIGANPSSMHKAGADAEKAMEAARRELIAALGGKPAASSLIFTGSGSEADNLAILGCARAKKRRGTPWIITTDSEHPAILKQAELLEEEGWEHKKVPTRGGTLDMAMLDSLLTENTAIVSLMAVNNETGAVYDIKRAFSLAKRKCPQALLHTDAIQAFMKIPFSAASMGADCVSLSAHKINGPKGAGALWVDNSVLTRKLLSPVIYGGGQEKGLRSGTENTAGIAAFAAAAKRNKALLPQFSSHTAELKALLISKLEESGIDFKFNTPPISAPHILSVTNPRVRSETLLHFLSGEGIYVSAGSACSSHAKHTSDSLAAFGLSEKEAGRTLRISLSLDTSKEDILFAAEKLIEGVSSLAGEW